MIKWPPRTYYIYRHIRLDTNEVFYIGLALYTYRYYRAVYRSGRNKHWINIVNSCNKQYKVEIMMEGLTKEEAVDKEKELITLYGRADLKSGTLCNLTDGGEGVRGLSKESRKKIAAYMKGPNNPQLNKPHTEEWKNSMREKMRGENNPNFGKVIPEYHKEINRQAQLGKKHSKESIALRVNKLEKKVINILTGELYPSISQAALAYKKSGQTLTRWINAGKYNLKFV